MPNNSGFKIKKVRSVKYLNSRQALLLQAERQQFLINLKRSTAKLAFSVAACMSLVALLFSPLGSFVTRASVVVGSGPTLTVINHVINDNGGSNIFADFTATVTGTEVSNSSFATAEAPGTTVNLAPGSYSVAITGPSGYGSSYDDGCSGNIDSGQNLTCNITTDDQAARITVITNVDNSNGGTKMAADFLFNVTGNSPVPSSASGTAAGVAVAIGSGEYGVTQAAVSGYVAGYQGCSGIIALGQMKTCTITDTDPAPAGTGSLTVINNVINSHGGSATSTDFTATVSGTTSTPASFLTTAGGTTAILEPGSYSVEVTGPSGYDSSYDTGCYGSIAAGNSKTCTITSVDQIAGLKVKVIVNNYYDGTSTPADFTVVASGTNVSLASFPGSATGTSLTLNSGSFSVDIANISGYVKALSDGCSGTILSGQVKPCTITLDDNSLIISGEALTDATINSVTVNWTTSHPATSRVVYDTVPHTILGAAPNYGYGLSTVEDPTLVTTHSVTITGLVAGTTYYFRPVSHGSPEVVGTEVDTNTSSNGGGGGNSGGGGSSGGGSSSGGGLSFTPTGSGLSFPVGQVAGAFTNTPSGQVLGASATLPRTGMPPVFLFLIFASIAALVDKKLKLI
jgi:hypothetical protein